VKVTEAHRQWWRDRFTRAEILWMADALFGLPAVQPEHAYAAPPANAATAPSTKASTSRDRSPTVVQQMRQHPRPHR
jgi:hypothetical protein